MPVVLKRVRWLPFLPHEWRNVVTRYLWVIVVDPYSRVTPFQLTYEFVRYLPFYVFFVAQCSAASSNHTSFWWWWGGVVVLRQKSHGEIHYSVLSSRCETVFIKTHFRGLRKRKGIMLKNTRLQRNDHQSLQAMIINRWEMFTFERRLKSTAAQREFMLEAHMERCIIWQKRCFFLWLIN